MKKLMAIIVITLILTSLVCGCYYVQPQRDQMDWQQPGQPQREEWPEEMPPEEMPPQEMPPQEMPPQEMPEPEEPQDMAMGAGHIYYAEGEVTSAHGDTVVIQASEGGSVKLRLSENTNWDPAVNDWQINKHNWLAVDYVSESGGRGEVIYIYINDTP